MSQPLSILYSLMDAKGLRDWAEKRMQIHLACLASAPPDQETVESIESSITPSDPWDFLNDSEDDDYDDHRIIHLEREYPDDFSHTVEV